MTIQWDGLLENANRTAGLLQSLPTGVKEKFEEALKIISDDSIKGADKITKIQKVFQDVDNAELKGMVLGIAGMAIKFNEWMAERLKREDEAVRTAANKVGKVLGCKEFLLSSDAQKLAHLNKIVANLSEKQLAAVKKFREDAKAKEQELAH